MRIRLKSPVVIRGFPNVKVGEAIEVPNSEAQVLLGMGVAERVEAEPQPDGLTTGRGIIEAREPEVVTREPVRETQPEKSSRRKPST